MDYKLELIVVPVDRRRPGQGVLHVGSGSSPTTTTRVSDEVRFVQLTPPGSACSIAIGTGLIDAEPGTAVGMQLVVDDADQARADCSSAGVTVGDVQEFPWGRFMSFADPDGNRWSVQQLPARG